MFIKYNEINLIPRLRFLLNGTQATLTRQMKTDHSVQIRKNHLISVLFIYKPIPARIH